MSDPTPPVHGQPSGPPPGQPYGQPHAPQPGAAPQGPPPGYQPGGYPPGGYAAAGGPAPSSSPFGASPAGVSLWLSLASIAAMALAVSLNEDDDNGWGRIGVWAGFAIVVAVLTLAPSIGRSINLSQEHAWKVGAVGAVGLIGFWVLFVLPSISMNVSFLATAGVVVGAAAVWLADGRPAPAGEDTGPQTW